MKQNTKTT